MTSTLSPSRFISCLGLVVVVAGCGDDVAIQTTDGSAVVETADPAEGEPVASEVVPETTAAVETTPPEASVTDAPPAPAATIAPADPIPETTTAPATSGRADLILRSNGIGRADFGQADIEVIPVLTAVLGNPVDDRLGEYPTYDDEYNVYVDFDDTGFSEPFGRTTCYDNEFCLQFGGYTGDDLRFVGWSQGGFEPASEPLITSDGVTIGSRYSDHLGVMTVNEGGCFTQGSGEVAGVLLFVNSESVPFSSFDEDGNYISQTPDPAEIVVTSMQAGDEPFFLFADC